MKNLKAIFCLLLFSITTAFSQPVTLLNKNECYVPPNSNMVVMDKYTFAKYHYTAQKYDTLKKEIVELDSLIRTKDVIQSKLMNDYQTLLKDTQKEVSVYQNGYNSAIVGFSSSVEKNNALLLDYKKLETKHKRAKRWRNTFLGSTLISTGILILLIRH